MDTGAAQHDGHGAGLLVLAATPIGCVEDASPRLAAVLAEADVVAAEDTRRLHRLVRELDVSLSGRVVSFFEGNEVARTEQLLRELAEGAHVVVATDAGMPSVSDPGFRLVAAAAQAGIRVTAVPGPSAVLAALAVSGLAVDRFCFEGFLPRKTGERRRRLEELRLEPRTTVFFEAPHRTAATLEAMAEVLGEERRAAVCRELTKTHEEVARATVGELVVWAQDGVRGEVTIVVAGVPPDEATSRPARTEWPALVAREVAGGMPRGEAIKAVARSAGVPKREVYDVVLGKDARPAAGGRDGS